MRFRCILVFVTFYLSGIQGLELPIPAFMLSENQIDDISDSSADETPALDSIPVAVEGVTIVIEDTSEGATIVAEDTSDGETIVAEDTSEGGTIAPSEGVTIVAEDTSGGETIVAEDISEASTTQQSQLEDPRVFGMNIGLHYILEDIKRDIEFREKVPLESLIKVLVMTHKIDKVDGAVNEGNKATLKEIAEYFPKSLRETIGV